MIIYRDAGLFAAAEFSMFFRPETSEFFSYVECLVTKITCGYFIYDFLALSSKIAGIPVIHNVMDN